MAKAMRVAGDNEGKGGKAMAMATKIAGKWTATATKRAMVMAMMVACKWQGLCQRGRWQWQRGWQAMKRAKVMLERAMVMVTRAAGEPSHWLH